MKKLVCLFFACVLTVLSGCGCDDGRNVDLVFIYDSNAVIVAVVADFEDQTSGAQLADSSPLKRSETFGFEARTLNYGRNWGGSRCVRPRRRRNAGM